MTAVTIDAQASWAAWELEQARKGAEWYAQRIAHRHEGNRMTPRTRYATVRGATAETIAQYLPRNYRVDGQSADGREVFISGEDNAGWTMDKYVIPRLGSGLIRATETNGPRGEGMW